MSELYYESSLAHHGIKGMQWGVRRYQKSGGSYTKRGLDRYNKSSEKYEKADANYTVAKDKYKSGAGSKQEYKDAKRSRKDAKRELNKSYDRLKTDNLADQGKELYKKGHTISGNLTANAIGQASIVIGSRLVNSFLAKKYPYSKLAKAAAPTIAIGGTFVNALLAAKTSSDNAKLRAFYKH